MLPKSTRAGKHRAHPAGRDQPIRSDGRREGESVADQGHFIRHIVSAHFDVVDTDFLVLG
jgi:hypothetical protein